MNIKFRINGQNIKRVDTEKIAANSKGFLYAEFEFEEEWENFVAKAVFKQGSKSWSQVLIDSACLVPQEVLNEGFFTVSMIGIGGNGEIRATTDEVKVDVRRGPSIDSDNTSDPTASEIEQLITIASSVRLDADNGVFNGTDGASFEVFSDMDTLEAYPTTNTAGAVRFIWAGSDAIYSYAGVTAELVKNGIYDGTMKLHAGKRAFITITKIMVLSGGNAADEETIKSIVDEHLKNNKLTYTLTAADKAAIVQAVFDEMGNTLLGSVDDDNTITISGNLADGTYTLKYEFADGTTAEIGTVTVGEATEVVINWCVDSTDEKGNKIGYITSTRVNSSGNLVTTQNYMEVTGFIPFKKGDILRGSAGIFNAGTNVNQTSYNNIACYDASRRWISNVELKLTNGTPAGLTLNDNQSFVFDSSLNDSVVANTEYIRTSLYNITDDSILTVNQEIE